MKIKLLKSLRGTIAVIMLLFATNLPITAIYADTPTPCPTGTGLSQNGNNCKITVCHRTNSVTNPYTSDTVSYNAANGAEGNDNGNGDHTTHTGPVFDKTATYTTPHSGDQWGDIIPPITGVTAGLNWTTAGQAIWNNSCNIPSATAAPATVSFNDTCGISNDTYTIPTTTGVTYEIGGSPVSAGSHPGTGSVTVTAVANTFYTLSGTSTWSHAFDTSACVISTTATAPTMVDLTCNANGSYTIPSKTGVIYKIGSQVVSAGLHTVSSAGTITVTAVADTGYTLTGTTSWDLVFHSPTGCDTAVTATTPTAVNNECNVDGVIGSYTIPSETGVKYYVNGSNTSTPAGTYNVHNSGTVSITAVADSGYALTGTATWSFGFQDPVTCNECPEGQVFNKDTQTCFTPGRGGDPTPPPTDNTPVLQLFTPAPPTTVNAPAKELVNTGSSALLNLFAGLFIIGVTAGMTILSRKNPSADNSTGTNQTNY